MIKLIKKFVFPLLFLVSSSTFAGLITTDLAENTYISHEGYDWTWASPVNITTQTFGGGFGQLAFTNIFEDANFHAGWMDFDEINDPDIYTLFEALTLGHFTRSDGSIIHSAAYWNSYYTEVDSTQAQFADRKGQKFESDIYEQFETFYVRATPPSQVPEPSTIMVFAIALIALSLRKRAIK
jgi:hypothetical protein